MIPLLLIAFCFALSQSNTNTEYVYVEDLRTEYSVHYREAIFFGKLDATGQFIPDPKIPPRLQNPNLPSRAGPEPPELMRNPKRPAKAPDWRVYEFHAGRLVPGVIKVSYATAVAYFYPELGGKIIELEDYLKSYDPGKSPPIYNLPGEIVKKGEKK